MKARIECFAPAICVDIDQFSILSNISYIRLKQHVPREIYNITTLVKINLSNWKISKNIIQLRNLQSVDNTTPYMNLEPNKGSKLIIDILSQMNLRKINYGYFSTKQVYSDNLYRYFRSCTFINLFIWVFLNK